MNNKYKPKIQSENLVTFLLFLELIYIVNNQISQQKYKYKYIFYGGESLEFGIIYTNGEYHIYSQGTQINKSIKHLFNKYLSYKVYVYFSFSLKKCIIFFYLLKNICIFFSYSQIYSFGGGVELAKWVGLVGPGGKSLKNKQLRYTNLSPFSIQAFLAQPEKVRARSGLAQKYKLKPKLGPKKV